MAGLMKGARSSFCHYLRCQFACQHRTFHTTEELLRCPVPGQSEIRDRCGLQTTCHSCHNQNQLPLCDVFGQHPSTRPLTAGSWSRSTTCGKFGAGCGFQTDPSQRLHLGWAELVPTWDCSIDASGHLKCSTTCRAMQSCQRPNEHGGRHLGQKICSYGELAYGMCHGSMSASLVHKCPPSTRKMAGLHHTRLSQAGAIRKFLPNLSREKPLKLLHRGLLMQLTSLQTCSASHLPILTKKKRQHGNSNRGSAGVSKHLNNLLVSLGDPIRSAASNGPAWCKD